MIGYSRPTHREGYLRKSEFVYDQYDDCYLCPIDHVLKYLTTTREGYREYASDSRRCSDCDLRGRCTQSRNKVKIITRHIWQDSKEQINDHRYEARGKAIYGRCKETVERSFADGEQLHGHRCARFRGILKAKLSAFCQRLAKT